MAATTTTTTTTTTTYPGFGVLRTCTTRGDIKLWKRDTYEEAYNLAGTIKRLDIERAEAQGVTYKLLAYLPTPWEELPTHTVIKHCEKCGRFPLPSTEFDDSCIDDIEHPDWLRSLIVTSGVFAVCKECRKAVEDSMIPWYDDVDDNIKTMMEMTRYQEMIRYARRPIVVATDSEDEIEEEAASTEEVEVTDDIFNTEEEDDIEESDEEEEFNPLSYPPILAPSYSPTSPMYRPTSPLYTRTSPPTQLVETPKDKTIQANSFIADRAPVKKKIVKSKKRNGNVTRTRSSIANNTRSRCRCRLNFNTENKK